MNFNFKNVKAVIFDMDGLLLDTEPIAFNAINHALKQHGKNELSLEQFKLLIGKVAQDTNSILCELYGSSLDITNVRKLSSAYIREHISEKGAKIKVGVLELLKKLEDLKLKKIVASSSSYNQVILKLKSADLLDRFENFVSGDQVQKGKPAPDIFLRAAELLNEKPECCLVLEDSIAGAQAAISAKIPLIIIPDLLEPPPEIKKLAVTCLDSLLGVCQLIDNHYSL